MDQDISITFPHVLIFFPLLAGLIAFFLKKDATVKSWALFSSIITLCVSLGSLYYANNKALSGLTFNYEWLKYIGASFSVSLDGMGRILTLLTAVSFPIIFVATYKNEYKNLLKEQSLIIEHKDYKCFATLVFVPDKFYQYIVYLNPGKKFKNGISAAMHISDRPATEDELQAFREIIASLIMMKG